MAFYPYKLSSFKALKFNIWIPVRKFHPKSQQKRRIIYKKKKVRFHRPHQQFKLRQNQKNSKIKWKIDSFRGSSYITEFLSPSQKVSSSGFMEKLRRIWVRIHFQQFQYHLLKLGTLKIGLLALNSWKKDRLISILVVKFKKQEDSFWPFSQVIQGFSVRRWDWWINQRSRC